VCPLVGDDGVTVKRSRILTPPPSWVIRRRINAHPIATTRMTEINLLSEHSDLVDSHRLTVSNSSRGRVLVTHIV
jgi:hypothetical protein